MVATARGFFEIPWLFPDFLLKMSNFPDQLS